MSRKFKILVVEDDEVLRDGMRELLEWENCEVETAQEGVTALAKVAKSPPDLIFLDLNMPKMPGQEFLRRLRAETAGRSEIPVVVMTALPAVEVSGVAAVLRKPAEFEEIVEKLNQIRRNWKHA